MPPEGNAVATFLNVDLDIRVLSGLDDLLKPIESSIIVLHRTNEDASLELASDFPSLEETIIDWIRLIDSFSPEAGKIWKQCEFRRANIGIQAGNAPSATSWTLSAEAVAMLAKAQIEIVLTLYAPS
jgi:hypothetical protein